MKLHEEKLTEIKNHFEDMEIPMSGAEELWSSIEQKQKKRMLPYWLGIGLLLLIGGAITTIAVQSQPNIISYKATQIESTIVAQPIVAEPTKKEPQSIVSIPVTKAIVDNKEVHNTTQLINSANLLRTTTAPSKSIDQTQYNNQTQAKHKTITHNNFITTTVSQDSPALKPRSKTSLPLTSQPQKKLIPFAEVAAITSFISADSERSSSVSLHRSSAKAKNYTAQYSVAQQLIEPTKNLQKVFFVEAGTQLYYTQERLSAIDQRSLFGIIPTSSVYSILRDQHFNPLVSTGGQLHFGVNINDKLEIKTGINYLYTEVQFFDRGLRGERTIEFDSTAFFTDNGTLQSFLGDVTFGQQINEVLIYEKVVEERWSIPLSIGYKFANLNKLRIQINAGMLFQLHNNYEGRFLNDELVIQDHDDSSNTINNTISYNIGLSGYYPIGKRIDMYISPQLRIQPRSFRSNLVAVSRYHFGSQIGIRLRI